MRLFSVSIIKTGLMFLRKDRKRKKKECVEITGTRLERRLPSHQNNLKAFSEKTGKKKLTSSE